MEYLEFTTENCRTIIKSTKNAVIAQRANLYLNNILAAYQIYVLWLDPTHIFSSVVVGSLIASVLWISSILTGLKQDLKLEKERLTHLENLREDKTFQGMIQQLKSSKEHYDSAVARIVENQKLNEAYLGNKRQESVSLAVGK